MTSDAQPTRRELLNAVSALLLPCLASSVSMRNHEAGDRGSGGGGRADAIEVHEDTREIRIVTSAIEAVVRKSGYVSGVAGGTFVDRKTGVRDVGFGLDIVDQPLESGSDASYRAQLNPELVYDFNDRVHGRIAKRWIEGPQVCTKAKELHPKITRGKGFVGVTMNFRYYQAAPQMNPGSEWSQTLVFTEGRRYFLASDRLTTANAGDDIALRIDMPGHIKHHHGDAFSEVYLSYYGRIPSGEFSADFAPDEKFLYDRARGRIPPRFIRAYRLRDVKTGRSGPWLAGMTLDPAVVSQAWCHQRGYVCMIEEFGGTPVRRGDSFSAAFIVGYFESIDEMNEVYDTFKGHDDLQVSSEGWRLVKSSRGR
jgi:hypothetical protein